MNIFQISIRNIKNKSLTSILNIVLFATGVFIISLLLLLKSQFDNQLEKNIAGIDLVIGAKGSPLQLILSSVYHVDYPTGNILLKDVEKLSHNPLVKHSIPMALGDSYHGFRIIGTNHDYISLYHGKLKDGVLWNKTFDVTLGSNVMDKMKLKIGDAFSGTHGFVKDSDHSHDDFQYKVTGILEKTGTILDQLILTNIESVWDIHSGHEHTVNCDHRHHEDCGHEHDSIVNSEKPSETDREITSMLVFLKNPIGAITLPRMVNNDTNMQAVSPVFEINRLYSLMGTSIWTISLIAYLIIAISGFSIFISLLSSMKERKYEIALIRVIGGSKGKIFLMVIIEGIVIALIGFLVGFILSRVAMFFVSCYTEDNFNYNLNSLGDLKIDLILLLISLVIGFLASILPALKAMNTDISKTLSK